MRVADRVLTSGRIALYRHPLLVRIAHWINALCLPLLLMSGLQILNAHPALYWGEVSRFSRPLLAFGSGDALAFPGWITLPAWQDLAGGRRWHFAVAWIFTANALMYAAHALMSGRIQSTLLPTGAQMRNIGRSVQEHLRLQFPRGDDARQYNVLQKLSYLMVMFGILPLMVLTGLTMSPGLDAQQHILTAIWGGRQSARTIHFIMAMALVGFFLVHMVAVVAAGPLTELRSMVTGWFVIKPDRKELR